MSVYHCPLCPLVFQYRTEVEWHLREEHRSRADEEADLRAELAAATGTLDWERLGALRSSRGRPAVTLLLSTVPAATMAPSDISRLRQLAEAARRRLAAEPEHDARNPLVEHRLAKAVATAETLPTERGLAVLVNHHDLAILTLPFAPHDRQIVDDGFATRDLEYSLRRYPHYRVLVLGRHPRVLEGRGQQLSEPPAAESSSGPRVIRDRVVREHDSADTLLDRRVELGGRLPLVLIGEHRHLEEFRRHSPHAIDVITQVIRPRLARTPVVELAAAAVERWLSDQQSQAVADLHDADQHDQLAWGIESAWKALESGTADRLWAEHDYRVPGRILRGSRNVRTIDDPTEPGAVDDLVDVLIARAERSGIPVDLLDPGTLRHSERVAVRNPLVAAGTGTMPAAQSMAFG